MLSLKAKKKIHPRIRASLSELFSTKEMIALGRFGTIVDVPSERTLSSIGEPAREVMLVIDGGVKVRRGSSISVVGVGGFIGVQGSTNRLAQADSSVSIEETSVLVFSLPDFDALLHTTPSIKSAISGTAAPRSEEVLDLTDRRPSNSVATHPLPSAA